MQDSVLSYLEDLGERFYRRVHIAFMIVLYVAWNNGLHVCVAGMSNRAHISRLLKCQSRRVEEHDARLLLVILRVKNS